MAWTIQEQTEKIGKAEITVRCKHVKFFPKHDQRGNLEGFGKLRPLVFSIIIKNDAGYVLRLTACVSGGDFNNPSFTISHPDKIGKPMIWVGNGKTRRKIKDELSADVSIPGEKEKYPYQMDFEKRITQLGSAALNAEVLGLFAGRLVRYASRQAA